MAEAPARRALAAEVDQVLSWVRKAFLAKPLAERDAIVCCQRSNPWSQRSGRYDGVASRDTPFLASQKP